MIQDIRLHGTLGGKVAYYATLSGEKLQTRAFYEERADGRLDVFLAGARLSLLPDGISHFGSGGGLSEYMFGTAMPTQDLAVKEVRNRLFLFGAYHDAFTDSLEFTDRVEGEQSFDRVFLEGNAAQNLFFLIQRPGERPGERRQRDLLRRVGKFLKRSPLVAEGKDDELLAAFMRELGEPDTLVLLARVVHLAHAQFQSFYASAYQRQRRGERFDPVLAANVARELGVDSYQQERIRIDTIYKFPGNKAILDEYKDLLVAHAGKEIGPQERARLTRLRNLAVRNDVPLSLFDTLDGMLLQDTDALLHREPEYLQHTREIFQGLFLSHPHAVAATPEDIAKLLVCKRQAMAARDNTFEEILLETGRLLDERSLNNDDFTALEAFGNIITYFDRFENTENILNQLAFMEDAELEPAKIRSLLNNKQSFDELDPGLFQRIIVQPLLVNPYVIQYGRRKLEALLAGLAHITKGDATFDQVADTVRNLAHEERLFTSLYQAARERIKNLYYDLNNKMDLDVLRRDVEEELHRREGMPVAITADMFNRVILDIRKESFYLNNLLPQIISGRDAALREDFLGNSGIDRFRVEEMEREYFQHEGLDPELLARLRSTH